MNLINSRTHKGIDMYKNRCYYFIFCYFISAIQKGNTIVRSYPEISTFCCKKNIIFLRHDFIVLSSLYIIVRESYFNATIDTITYAEYLDTVRGDVITLPQSYVNIPRS